MLSADRLTLAIDIQSQSYQLLRWVADAVRKGLLKFKHDQALRKRIANAAFATFSRIEGKKMEKQEADVYRKLLRKQ